MEELKRNLEYHFTHDMCSNDLYNNIEDQLTEFLPHGSGIDSRWEFDYFKNGKIKCSNFWYKMNDNGYYCGYLGFWFTIDFQNGKFVFSNVKLQGKDTVLVRDYLNDTIAYYETLLNQ